VSRALLELALGAKFEERPLRGPIWHQASPLDIAVNGSNGAHMLLPVAMCAARPKKDSNS